jgi:hypothetical protein
MWYRYLGRPTVRPVGCRSGACGWGENETFFEEPLSALTEKEQEAAMNKAPMNQQEQGKKISQVIAKCWADEGFKQKVLADPVATLSAEGVELPAGLRAPGDRDHRIRLIATRRYD